jgi:hypothetical protein
MTHRRISMRIARRLVLLAVIATISGAVSLVAVHAEDSSGGAPAAAADTGAPASDTDAANCGMGGEGSCCQACQQRAKFIAEGKVKDKDAGCPCQRARELREQQQ